MASVGNMQAAVGATPGVLTITIVVETITVCAHRVLASVGAIKAAVGATTCVLNITIVVETITISA